MTLDAWFSHIGALWLVAAVILGLAELAIPGVFLIFLAIAAAITGVATLVLADLPLSAQIASFAIWSAVAVMIGKRWYRDFPVETSDPLLNDRAARMIGSVVTVAEPIEGGQGRVRIGDGVWPASGPEATVGAKVRVIAVEDGVVHVELI